MGPAQIPRLSEAQGARFGIRIGWRQLRSLVGGWKVFGRRQVKIDLKELIDREFIIGGSIFAILAFLVLIASATGLLKWDKGYITGISDS